LGHAIREARSPLVEGDQSRERREAIQEARKRGLFPRELDVRDPAGDINQVERAFADDLIGDVQVAAAGVFGFRMQSDNASVCIE
jgi:hypothetical protein